MSYLTNVATNLFHSNPISTGIICLGIAAETALTAKCREDNENLLQGTIRGFIMGTIFPAIGYNLAKEIKLNPIHGAAVGVFIPIFLGGIQALVLMIAQRTFAESLARRNNRLPEVLPSQNENLRELPPLKCLMFDTPFSSLNETR